MKHDTQDFFEFPCGCKFPIISNEPLRLDLNLDIQAIPLDCKRTWDLFATGRTKGVFQLESPLGQNWSKKLKPENINELSDLIALIRPGSLESYIGDKNVIQHYVDRKHHLEQIEYFHPALENVLKSTKGLVIYQENAMQIAQKIAGFDLQQADTLRKAIGKKLPEVMAKVKIDFLEGCKKQNIVTTKEAEEIFGWIEKAQRYSFCAAHSVSYAHNAYMAAYVKAHFQRTFYVSWLYYSKDKQSQQEEINLLINDAKVNGIQVYPPDFRHNNKHFKLINQKIYFGLLDIKGVGNAVVNKIYKLLEEMSEQSKWSWTDFLIFFSQKVNSTAVKNLIKVGALDYYEKSRTKMLYEYNIYTQLSKREQQWFIDNNFRMWDLIDSERNLGDALAHILDSPVGKLGGIANKNRKEKIISLFDATNNPPYKLEDMIEWTAAVEEHLLGISLTCHLVDAHDKKHANCTCFDFIHDKNVQRAIFIAGHIDKVNEITTKNKKQMAFVTISDSTCALSDVVVFPEMWNKYKDFLEVKNVVLLCGSRGKNNSFIVEKVLEIS